MRYFRKISIFIMISMILMTSFSNAVVPQKASADTEKTIYIKLTQNYTVNVFYCGQVGTLPPDYSSRCNKVAIVTQISPLVGVVGQGLPTTNFNLWAIDQNPNNKNEPAKVAVKTTDTTSSVKIGNTTYVGVIKTVTFTSHATTEAKVNVTVTDKADGKFVVGAQILVDDKLVATTGNGSTNLTTTVGAHTLKVQKSGYDTSPIKNITANATNTTPVSVSLAKTGSTGTINVKSNVSGVTISIVPTVSGTGDSGVANEGETKFQMLPNEYKVTASNASYTPASQDLTVKVEAGKTVEASFTFTATPATSTGNSKCENMCPSAGFFSVSGSIQKAVCVMQCQIIDWQASIIGWTIGKVLYPALGLCPQGEDCTIVTK